MPFPSGCHLLAPTLGCIALMHFMNQGMFCWTDYNKILRPIVQPVTIYMVDKFASSKFPTECVFHYLTMLTDCLAIDG